MTQTGSLGLKPIGFWSAVALFAATPALVYLGVYRGIPMFMASGTSFLQGYLVCFYAPFVVMFAFALTAVRLERGRLSWSALQERCRLRRMDARSWMWAGVLTVGGLAAYLALTFTGRVLASLPWLAPPAYFPAEINPLKAMVPGVFMDTMLRGQWWIIPAYAAGS
jgi:hypothetical protein